MERNAHDKVGYSKCHFLKPEKKRMSGVPFVPFLRTDKVCIGKNHAIASGLTLK